MFSSNVLSAIEAQAEWDNSRDAVRFLGNGEDVTQCVSYGALRHDVEQVAAGLIAAGLARRPVILSMPPGVGFVTAFLACLRAGVIAIPAPQPTSDQARERLCAILKDARPDAILAHAQDRAGLHDGRTLTLECLPPSMHVDLPEHPAPDLPAFVQYSSGSTREPRGIVITHGNLAANQAMIRTVFGPAARETSVSWLPHTHDMGLIGAILQPLFVGATAVLMTPLAFVQKPLRWLKAIERHHATTSGGPTFGFEFCVRRISPESAQTLDLSCWQVAFCGSEPIKPDVLANFAQRFSTSRFNAKAVLPCYGLAEGTLLVTGSDPHTGIRALPLADDGKPAAPSRQTKAVSCGRPPPDCDVMIDRGPSAELTRADEVGEVCIAGPHVSEGTWCGVTSRVVPFTDIVVDPSGRRFVRTGDCGALIDGELIILDRIKDVINLRGRNYYAVDIEASVMLVPDAPVIAAAAFSVARSGREQLVLLCELSTRERLRSNLGRLEDSLRSQVGERCGLLPDVVFVRHGALPRTSSGKIRRHAAKTMYEGGAFGRETVAVDPAA